MDVDRLRYFSTLINTSNINEAAKILRITPAALSKAMKTLQSELNQQLILRSGRGIIITDNGLKLKEPVEQVLAQIDKLSALPHHKNSDSVIIRMGSFEVFTTYFLGELVSQEFQNDQLEVHELIPGDLEIALKNRTIDLGLTYIPIPHPDLEFLKIATIKMNVFARPKFASVPFEKLPFVVPITPISGSPNKVRGLDGWPDDKIPRYQKYKVTLLETALELCRKGLAAAYLPSFIVTLHNNNVRSPLQLQLLKNITLPKDHDQNIFIVKRKNDIENKVIKKLARALRLMLK